MLRTLSFLGLFACKQEEDPNATPVVIPSDIDSDGYSESDGDCDDTDSSIFPTATETFGDSLDQNCDGIDGGDADSDGYASIASGGLDCDDQDPSLTPLDQDGDGESICDGDCNDNNAEIHPDAEETPGDGVDSNCNGDDDT